MGKPDSMAAYEGDTGKHQTSLEYVKSNDGSENPSQFLYVALRLPRLPGAAMDGTDKKPTRGHLPVPILRHRGAEFWIKEDNRVFRDLNRHKLTNTDFYRTAIILNMMTGMATLIYESLANMQSIGMYSFLRWPLLLLAKGGVENINKIFREYFPKGTDFRDIAQEKLNEVNERPRKKLGFSNPKIEFFKKLH